MEADLENLKASDVAWILDVSRQQVDLYKKGDPALQFNGKGPRGATCHVRDLIEWSIARRMKKAKKEEPPPPEPGGPDLYGAIVPRIEVSQAKKEAALAEKHEIDVAIKRGELISVAEVETAQANRVMRARSKFLGMGAKLGPRLEDRSAPYIQKVIDTEVEAALTELSTAGEEAHVDE